MKTTQNHIAHKNTVLAVTVTALRGILLPIAYGAVFQAFLVSLGFSSSLLYINSTILQLALILITPLCSKWADKGHIIKRAVLCHLPTAVLFALYLPICISRDNSLAAFWYLTACCFMQVVVVSLYNIIDYKLPYLIFSADDYGTMLSLGGIICNLISLGIGILISFASGVLGYPMLMFIACCVCIGITLLSAVCVSRLKLLASAEQIQASNLHAAGKVSVFMMFKMPIFARLAPANILRGVSGAATAVMAAVALDLGYDENVITMIISVSSGVSIAAYLFFALASHKFKAQTIIAIGCVLFCLFPLMLLRSTSTVFLLLLFVVLLGRVLVDIGVPYLLRRVVPMDIAAPYNAWRMVLYNIGSITMTAIAAFIPVDMLLITATAAQLLVGISYCFDRELLHRLQAGIIP